MLALMVSSGRYYVSLGGYNNALTPSRVACSDGVTYDTTPPALVNVILAHARGAVRVGCTETGEAWLVNANLSRVALSDVTPCSNACTPFDALSDVSHLPVSDNHTLDRQLSEQHCQKLPSFARDTSLVLPSDYVRVSWQGVDAESDMEEYYVGLGSDRTAAPASDLLPFTPTHGHGEYHARHSGLGHGDVFFLFLRAVSKAGLEDAVTLGPITIDSTPPEFTASVAARIEGNQLLVTWEEEYIVDTEQPPGMALTLSFRVGHEGGNFVTPWLKISDTDLAACRQLYNVTGCARYPLQALYLRDTQPGDAFFIQLHAINVAGHVTSVNSSSLRVPLRSPPDHALVMDVVLVTESGATVGADVDPQNATITTSPPFSSDVDAILQMNEVCAAWRGLDTPEVTVEVGLGFSSGHDDVIPFHRVSNNASRHCFNVTSAPFYKRLFSVVRATSSGGTAVFSSDGVVLVASQRLQQRLARVSWAWLP
jgi:hypothetical protein